MRWLRLVCILTLLLAPIGARPRPRPIPPGWLVTAAEVLAQCPGSFKIRPELEKASAEQEFMDALTADYEYEADDVVVLSSCSKELSSLDASMVYSATKLSARYYLADEKEQYLTKSIRAGEESRCIKIKNRHFWAFSFRQKRHWGFLCISGPPLTDRQVQQIVTRWVKRLK